ncbi:CHASE2 domain-containing protein [Candidatus Latescibacterota bacterium]
MKKKSASRKKNLLQDIVLVGLIFCLFAILSYTDILSFFNFKLYDLLVEKNRGTPEHKENVVFVCIDQNSIDFFSNEGIGWPWPRDYYGSLVWYLSNCEAKAIVFDIIYSEEDMNGSSYDDDFADAIRESGRTYLVIAGREDHIAESSYDNAKWLIEETEPFRLFDKLPVFNSALLPISKLSQGAQKLGLANIDPENDGIHRRYPLVSKIGDNLVPSLGFAVVRDILDEETLNLNILDRMSNKMFADSEGKFLIKWYGEGGTGRGGKDTDGVFNYYSYHAVLASAVLEERGETPLLPGETFKDKIVMVGSNAPGLFDLKATPFTHVNLYPGMEIHATAIENMLSGDFIYQTPYWVLLLSMAVITIVLFCIHRYLRNLRAFIILYFLLIICELSLAYFFLSQHSRWISSAEILGTTTFVFLGLVLSGYFTETKEKRVLRSHFGRYVNETVLRDILDNPTAVNFNGRTVNATIMATDIAGFTSISEQLPPHEVVARLNDYLSEVSETLIDNGAFINKYIGDAILALYGAFEEQEHKRKGCLAALNAQKVIHKKIEQAKSENKIPFVTRIGLTTGEMTLGNIGSARKIEYTVIGDTVNTAFRLEGLNKYYHTTILVSEITKNGAGDDFEFRLLDMLCVKGKETPEQVFELMGVKGEVDPERLRRRDEFEAAIKLYQEKKFTEAKELFTRLQTEGDETSEVFKKRCDDFIKEPPPPEWNGVWVMKRK